MMLAPFPQNEIERLKKLYSYQILDTLNDPKFDQITETVAKICGTKIALISLIDHDRQWFKSKHGIEASETPRDISYCGHAILGNEIFEIQDSELDARFCDNPLFLGEPHVRFYAGMPLITSDQFRLGTLCVIDSKAKKLNEEQRAVLKTFAQNIVEIFELNLKNKSLNVITEQYQELQNMVLAGAWEMDVETEETIWSDQIYNIYKIPYGTPTNKINGISYYAPHDREKLSVLINKCVTHKESFDEIFEFYDSEGIKKWVKSIGKPFVDKDGVVKKVLGTFQDVTKQVEKEKDLALVLSNINEGYWDWHIKSDYEFMSPKFWKILGYDPKSKQHHPSEWQKLIHPEDLERTLILFDQHVKSKGEQPFSLDVRYLHSKGYYHWIKCEGEIVEWDSNNEAQRMVGTHRDIHSEKAQTHEAQITKDAIDSFTIVSRTDKFGKIIYANNLFCEISQYSSEELIGMDHRILNSGYHPKNFFSEMWETILKKKTWRGEIQNKAKDGSLYWVDTTLIPMTSVNGEINGFLSFRYDVTQRKIAELSLQESENKHKQLFYQSKDAVMTIAPPNWTFKSCNETTLKMFKISSESEFIKLGPWDVSPEYQPSGVRSSEVAQHAILKAMEEGSYYFEWTHQTTDGKSISCTVLLSRITEAENVYLQATVRDISKEKELVNKLAESNAYLDLALEGANLGIWDWDLRDNSVKFDERWASMLGLNIHEIKMELATWESLVHSDDIKKCYDDIKAYMNGETSFYENVHRMKHKDGHWVYILDRGRFSVKDESGKPIKFTGTHFDVTELMSNKLKLDLFFKKAPYGFAFCDMDGKFIEINDEFIRITGHKKDELNQLSYWDLTPVKYKKDEEEQISSLQKKGSYGPYRKEYIRKDGSTVAVELNGFIVQDYDGKTGIWSIVEDITQKVKLENEKNQLLEKYHKSNEKLEAIFNFSPVVVYECLINKNWTMNFISPYIETISGHKDSDFINDNVIAFAQIIHPEDQDYVDKFIQQSLMQNTGYSINYRIIHKNGDIRWVWEQGAKTPDSNSLIGVIVDITEKKKAESMTLLLSHVRSKFIELSSNKEVFFKYLLDKVLDLTSSEYGFIGEILEDSKGKYLKTFALTDISWNDETKKLYQENVSQGLEFKNLNTLFGEVIKTGKLLISNNAPSHPKAAGIPNGHPPLEKFMGIPILYNNEIFAMVGVANNKAGYKEEEFNLLRPFFDLIGEMIQSIKMNSELELQKKIALHHSKLASIGELAAGVGHEINNPLAIIQGHLEMLSHFCISKNICYQEIDTKITKSLKGVERISSIVKGLRAFARADDEEMSLLNVSELLKETQDMLYEIYTKENISMEFRIEDDLWIMGNRGRLQQVFVNILNNAKDALADSEIKNITVRAQKNAKMVEIKICDTGPGIPDNLKEKIFDPFFTTKQVNKGTGIGLALVSSIVKDHNGAINIDSKHGHGACFILSLQSQLQSKSQTQTLAPVEIPIQAKAKARGRVLVVDDEVDLRDILQSILESHGLEVFTASNGKEALDYVTKDFDGLDLIISDMNMPIMNGPDLARAVRSFGKFKGGLLFVTGGVNVSLEDYKQIVDGVIPKPFNKDKIIGIVNKWIKNENL